MVPFPRQEPVFSSSWKTPIHPSVPGHRALVLEPLHTTAGVAASLCRTTAGPGLCSGPDSTDKCSSGLSPFEGISGGSFVYLGDSGTYHSVEHAQKLPCVCRVDM